MSVKKSTPAEHGHFTSDTARASARRRWEASAAERTERKIAALVAAAPPLSEAVKSRLRAMLGGA